MDLMVGFEKQSGWLVMLLSLEISVMASLLPKGVCCSGTADVV